MNAPACIATYQLKDYDLAATLASGQAFRWARRGDAWEGVVCGRWVRLTQQGEVITAERAVPTGDWAWLENYLQVNVDLDAVTRTFPDDEPMQAAGVACRGLRLLRQEPWECLASFILSTTKQIVQIQEIVRLLCQRFGNPVMVPAGLDQVCGFPSADRIARCAEAELRACKMGFRAPNLLASAKLVSERVVDLERLPLLSVGEARAELMRLPGVGRKVADCVLLFAYGFQSAFPLDVWIMKALHHLYFARRRKVSLRVLQEFSGNHFGPYAGYAQQYLFHYMRVHQAAVRVPRAPNRRVRAHRSIQLQVQVRP